MRFIKIFTNFCLFFFVIELGGRKREEEENI